MRREKKRLTFTGEGKEGDEGAWEALMAKRKKKRDADELDVPGIFYLVAFFLPMVLMMMF